MGQYKQPKDYVEDLKQFSSEVENAFHLVHVEKPTCKGCAIHLNEPAIDEHSYGSNEEAEDHATIGDHENPVEGNDEHADEDYGELPRMGAENTENSSFKDEDYHSVGESDDELLSSEYEELSDEEFMIVRSLKKEKCKCTSDENFNVELPIRVHPIELHEDAHGSTLHEDVLGSNAPEDVPHVDVNEVISEYEESEEEIITRETSQEGVETDVPHMRKKVRSRVYNPKYDVRNVKLTLGMKFDSKLQFKEAVQSYGIVNGFNIIWTKSCAQKMEAKMKAYRSKWEALQSLRGLVEDHYAMIGPYLVQLRIINPTSLFNILYDRAFTSAPSVFQRLYIGFDALKKGFMQGCRLACRPIIGLDGCFLKTFLGGQFLSAIGRDENNQMFPIAWVVVVGENYLSWSWFLGILFDDRSIDQGYGLTLISDQQKGLEYAIKQRVSGAEHRNCARHIYAN
ncbi:hypothetical protein Cni_G16283 [Canna indica]|uniref:MULE transposase domain-containing protein n=1 Tax=Canna indica TaxID=4628 RepID=A0AAQ3KET5_9LILI|nr:hypothetical protein Cni_G16283 [Canna indica]